MILLQTCLIFLRSTCSTYNEPFLIKKVQKYSVYLVAKIWGFGEKIGRREYREVLN